MQSPVPFWSPYHRKCRLVPCMILKQNVGPCSGPAGQFHETVQGPPHSSRLERLAEHIVAWEMKTSVLKEPALDVSQSDSNGKPFAADPKLWSSPRLTMMTFTSNSPFTSHIPFFKTSLSGPPKFHATFALSCLKPVNVYPSVNQHLPIHRSIV